MSKGRYVIYYYKTFCSFSEISLWKLIIYVTNAFKEELRPREGLDR